MQNSKLCKPLARGILHFAFALVNSVRRRASPVNRRLPAQVDADSRTDRRLPPPAFPTARRNSPSRRSNFIRPKPEPYRVRLASGPVAYVVPDRELPLVNIAISVHTGDWVEPEGKEGLTDLCGSLLTRAGTETRTAQELEERLAFLAAALSSGIQGAQGTVSLNLLSKDLDEGLAILREVLTAPRFQPDRIDLQKQQMLQAMKQRNDDSSHIEQQESGFLAYGENFWDNRHQTAASVAAITRDDLLAFHKQWFWPSNFVVAVSGDFDRDAMVTKLETLFANWPWAGTPPPPIPTNITMAAAGVYLVDKDVNQGRVAMLLPGIMRDNPDYFPLIIMNDILGGGGFTSRIMNRVRSDEGLAYSADSSFPGRRLFSVCLHGGLSIQVPHGGLRDVHRH